MAKQADKYALVRSVYSDGFPDHESGLQLIDAATADFVTLPGLIGFIGAAGIPACSRLQVARLRPQTPSKAGGSRNCLPHNSFADNCIRARQLIEVGIPNVRVNMFDTVFNRITWDSHGTRPFSTIHDYKDTVGPAFDIAYSTLLEDLHQRGLLQIGLTDILAGLA